MAFRNWGNWQKAVSANEKPKNGKKRKKKSKLLMTHKGSLSILNQREQHGGICREKLCRKRGPDYR